MTWEQALDDLAARVDDLDRRLDQSAWDELDEVPFVPPAVVSAMTPEQHQRAAALLERVAACNRRLRRRMAETQAELSAIGDRKQGARAYAWSEG